MPTDSGNLSRSGTLTRSGTDILERIHAVVSLLIVGSALYSLFSTPGPQGGPNTESGLLNSLQWPFVFGPGMLFAMRNPKRMLSNVFLTEPFLLGIIALAIASTTWSVLPDVTLSKAVRLASFFLYGCYLAGRYSVDDLISLARWSVRVGLILSILTAILNPKIGVHSDFIQGSWRGLYPHKNTLGRNGSLIICLALAARLDKLDNSKRFLFTDFLLGSVVLVFAESRTALLLTPIIVFWSGLYQLWLASGKSLRGAYAAFGSLSSLALLPLLFLLFSLVGRSRLDHLLTGRVSLWRTLLYFISKKPWTGYGYSAFFHEQAFGKVIELWESWDIPHAHNAVLELWITMGIGAVILYFFSLGLMLWRCGKASGRCGHTAFMILGFNAIIGLTETACYPRPELTTLLFIYMTVYLSRASRRQLPLQSSSPSSQESTGPPKPDSPPSGD